MADKTSLILSVSSATFSEIAMRMQEKGINIGEGDIKALTSITLEKGSELTQPHDWPQVKLRKDCLVEAMKLAGVLSGERLIELIDEIYQYVLTGKLEGKKETTKPGGWN